MTRIQGGRVGDDDTGPIVIHRIGGPREEPQPDEADDDTEDAEDDVTPGR